MLCLCCVLSSRSSSSQEAFLMQSELRRWSSVFLFFLFVNVHLFQCFTTIVSSTIPIVSPRARRGLEKFQLARAYLPLEGVCEILLDMCFHVWIFIQSRSNTFVLFYFSFQQVMNESFLPLIGEKQTKFEHEIDKMEVKMMIIITIQIKPDSGKPSWLLKFYLVTRTSFQFSISAFFGQHE